MLREALAGYLEKVEQAILRCRSGYVERYVEEVITPERVASQSADQTPIRAGTSPGDQRSRDCRGGLLGVARLPIPLPEQSESLDFPL